MTAINWDLVQGGVDRASNRMVWQPYGAPLVADLHETAFHDGEISAPWEVSEDILVGAAITGAFFRPGQNAAQPISTAQILDEALEVAEAGASAIHIHVRDDNGYNVLSPERFHDVIVPLRKAHPNVPIDGCLVPALPGEWDKMHEMLGAGLLDAVPVNATATYVGDSLFAMPVPMLLEKTRLILEAGLVPEIAVYTDGDISNADRYLFRSGLLSAGATWLVLPALPGCSPMANPDQMIAGLTRLVSAIRDVDPLGTIIVCAAGVASSYLAAMATIMGLHVRVGMEDTTLRWPHRHDVIESNLQVFQQTKSMVESLGRQVATPARAREIMRMPALNSAGIHTHGGLEGNDEP